MPLRLTRGRVGLRNFRPSQGRAMIERFRIAFAIAMVVGQAHAAGVKAETAEAQSGVPKRILNFFNCALHAP